MFFFSPSATAKQPKRTALCVQGTKRIEKEVNVAMATCHAVLRWGDWVRFWVGWRYDFRKWSVVCGGEVLENHPKWLRLGERIWWNVSGFEPGAARVRVRVRIRVRIRMPLGLRLGPILGLV